MTKEEFRAFCKDEFKKWGFRKHKSGYYLNRPEDLIFGLFLQKSSFGPAYYVNCCCHIQSAEDNGLPSYHDMDIDMRRIVVMSKSIHSQTGETFITSQIDYEEYTYDELVLYFNKSYEESILPVIRGGKEYVKNNLVKFHLHPLHSEKVKQKLMAET